MPDSLPIRFLHHLAVPTRDPERSAAFYEHVLGMRRIARPAFSFGGAWLYHEPSGLQFHIIEHGSAPGSRSAIDTLAQHFAMAADDLDIVEARLGEHGIQYRRQINAAGFHQIFFQDPDGNTIEVGVYPPDSSGHEA